MRTVAEIQPDKQGRKRYVFDDGTLLALYRSEAAVFGLEEGRGISEQEYEHLVTEVIGKRAKKRAMFLLEQMERTEHQLREKLAGSGYPEKAIEEAIAYVKRFHYLDDRRYAEHYVLLNQERMSRRQLQQKLLQKGLRASDIACALEQAYEADEDEQIFKWLRKRNYSAAEADDKEFRRMYGFLMRRGFSSAAVLRAMKTDAM